MNLTINMTINVDELPPWANWIACDQNGDLWAFKNKPIAKGSKWFPKNVDDEKYCEILLPANDDETIQVIDWENLIVKISKD